MTMILCFLALGAAGTVGMGVSLTLGSMRQVENWGFVAVSGAGMAGVLATVLL